MNILYACADRGIPVRGNKGASVHVRSITSALERLGHRVTVAARSWDGENPPPAVHRCVGLPKDHEAAVSQLEQLIEEERPDVCIERYSLDATAGRIATRRHGIPLTLEVNAPLYAEATRFRRLDDPAALHREHALLRSVDRIHVVSGALRRYVRSVAPEVPSAWIPNGADVSSFRAAAASATGSDGVLAGFVGSMKPWHGVDQLLHAFAGAVREYPTARLLAVGAGPQLDAAKDLARQLGIADSVEFTGSVPHDRVPALVAGVDVAVAPYLPLEDFYFEPLKVIEYLAAGKPVIYSDQGDLRSLVGDAGRGYPAGSTTKLAAALENVIGNADTRLTMAAAAHDRGATLDWSAIAGRVARFAAGQAEGLEPSSAVGGGRC